MARSSVLRSKPGGDGPPDGLTVSVSTTSLMNARTSHKATVEAAVQAAYAAVPEHIREDICEATRWARDTLMRREGTGHQFYVTATSDQLVCCSFAKVEWSADHCGRGMEHGAEAIVMAVCEYLNGA